MSRALASLLLVPLVTGCLSAQYTVRQDELARLAQLPPEQRTASVRATQQLSILEDDVTPAATYPMWVAPVVVVGPTPGPSRVHVRGGSGGVRGGGGGSRPGSSRNDSSASDSADSAIAVVVIASLAAVGLAATEGARFDGTVSAQAEQPLYLVGPSGELEWVTLSKLSLEQALWADHGVMNDYQGLTLLERAPLDRQGFSFGVDLGVAQLDSQADETGLGFASRITFGAFPISQLGLRIGAEYAFGESTGSDYVFNQRYFGELVAFPFRFGILHLGAYGLVGFTATDEDRHDGRRSEWGGFYYGGGPVLELEWTTRLAVQLRAGLNVLPGVPGMDAQNVAPEATIGLSIY